MKWFRSQEVIEDPDPQLPPEVHEVDLIPFTSEPAPGPAERYARDRGVLDAAGRWTRDVRVPPDNDSQVATSTPRPMTVPWQSEPPNRPGLWWWRSSLEGDVHLGVVIDFGGRLCVRTRRGGGCTYTTVSALTRSWAGPVSSPADMSLDDYVER